MKHPDCCVEVGTHTGPFWINGEGTMTVCDRHRRQFNEREAEFGMFGWQPYEGKKIQ